MLMQAWDKILVKLISKLLLKAKVVIILKFIE